LPIKSEPFQSPDWLPVVLGFTIFICNSLENGSNLELFFSLCGAGSKNQYFLCNIIFCYVLEGETKCFAKWLRASNN
jgi:hypothetical protein